MQGAHGVASDAAHGTGTSSGRSSRRQLRIVHVVSSLGVGGMERMLLQLAAAQQDAGHRVSVLAIRHGPLAQEAAERSLRFKVLGAGRVGRSVRALRWFFLERPDIVHVHNPTSLHYAVLSRLVSPSAIVVTLHGDQDTHARLGTPFEWSLTTAAVIVSHAAGTTLQLPPQAGRFTVVHNGIASPPPNRQNRESARDEMQAGNAPVGVMVARIDGRKGHGTLLRSVRLLQDSRSDFRIWIVGDGAERASAERLIEDLRIDPRLVSFLGRRSDIDRLLDAADFFVLPSDIEGLPMSILEAMAHGLPIVASNVGGVPEVIEHNQSGLLVQPGDPAALAAAIGELLDQPAVRARLGGAARERANTEFSLSAMVERYEELYLRALGGRADRV